MAFSSKTHTQSFIVNYDAIHAESAFTLCVCVCVCVCPRGGLLESHTPQFIMSLNQAYGETMCPSCQSIRNGHTSNAKCTVGSSHS